MCAEHLTEQHGQVGEREREGGGGGEAESHEVTGGSDRKKEAGPTAPSPRPSLALSPRAHLVVLSSTLCCYFLMLIASFTSRVAAAAACVHMAPFGF